MISYERYFILPKDSLDKQLFKNKLKYNAYSSERRTRYWAKVKAIKTIEVFVVVAKNNT